MESTNNKLAWAAFGLLFLFATQYFQHNIGGYGLQLSFNNVVWIAVLVMITVGIVRGTNRGTWTLPSRWPWYLGLFLCLFLPLLWSDNTAEYAIGRFFGVLGGLLFLLALFQCFEARQAEKGLLLIIIGSVSLQSLLGTLQLFGWDWLPIGRISEAGVRPQGIFQQPNVFASYVATGVMASLWCLVKYQAPKRVSLKVAWYGVLLSCLTLGPFCLYIALSRTGVLALALGLFCFLWVRKPASRPLMIGVAAIILGELAGLLFTEVVQGAVRGAAGITESNGRTGIWTVSLQLFSQHPLLGSGLGSFEAAYAWQRGAAFAATGLLAMANVDHPHNELLFWAVEGGLLPVTGIVAFSLTFLLALRHLGRDAWGYGALLLPIILHCMTEYPFYHSAAHWFVFLTLLFLVESRLAPLKDKPVALPYVWKSLSMIALLVGSLFLVTNLHTIAKLTQVARANKVAQGSDSPLAPLLDIVNPIVFQNHITHLGMYTRLQVALATHDQQALRDYISWGWQFSHNVVRPDTFIYMREAAEALGDEAEVARIESRARWLYPMNPQFKHHPAASGAQLTQ
ncbi:PglL family O-oligosaccharyltransferase [Gallaecimonas xiamenensis]|uniref:Lipid A core-O-antigen ligase n=1 Tax=Gallaecimonas xiamenensis 3-C-1 TaxID=745411 RepID=K2KDG9_9GAMM|nr:Wzy polymerase domain-containing protein [Gallaecimonas xiamenensis]EKE75355.1 lipid A core - O-antigen ligase [Gallaecimonas xiamenensis 3-C-1]